jgi:hypothetical protein
MVTIQNVDGFLTVTQTVDYVDETKSQVVATLSNDAFENDSDRRFYLTIDKIETGEDGYRKDIFAFVSREFLESLAESIATVLAK